MFQMKMSLSLIFKRTQLGKRVWAHTWIILIVTCNGGSVWLCARYHDLYGGDSNVDAKYFLLRIPFIFRFMCAHFAVITRWYVFNISCCSSYQKIVCVQCNNATQRVFYKKKVSQTEMLTTVYTTWQWIERKRDQGGEKQRKNGLYYEFSFAKRHSH